MLLEGIFVPVTTPFRPDGRLYEAKLEANVDHYGRTPAAGLIVLGETGEAARLTDAESALVLDVAIAAAAPARVMIAGVARAGVAAALDLAACAARAGYDAVALRPACPASEQQMFLEVMLDRAPLPMILAAEGLLLPAEVLAELLGHPQAIGVLGSSATGLLVELRTLTSAVSREVTVTPVFAAVTGRMQRQATRTGDLVSAQTLSAGAGAISTAGVGPLRTRLKRVGLQFLEISDTALIQALKGGATGAAPSLAACIPQACCEVYQAFRDGDPALAAEKSERVAQAAEWVCPVAGKPNRIKYGCDLNGYFGGRPRLPGLPLTAEERGAVERALAGMRN